MTRGPDDRRTVLGEIAVMWLATLVVVRVWLSVVDAGLPEVFKAVVPILFMYVPVGVCWLRGVDSFSYPLYLPRFRDTKPWLEALKLNAFLVGASIVPYLLIYHYWTTWVMGGYLWAGALPHENGWPWMENLTGLPPELFSILMLVGYHLFFVAIPEEFFYRGYLQTRLDEVFRPRWRIFGADLGWGWLITCVIFAFGHSIVVFQWWHVFIVFPSLVFGWLRARTGGVLAGAMFHAWCNVTVGILDHVYGLVVVG